MYREILEKYMAKGKTTENCYFLSTPYAIKTDAKLVASEKRLIELCLRIANKKDGDNKPKEGFIFFGCTKSAQKKAGALITLDYTTTLFQLLQKNIAPVPNFEIKIETGYKKPIAVFRIIGVEGIEYKTRK